MADDRLFTVAGISKLKGEYKVRFANDLVSRIKVLQKNDHEDIRLIDLGASLSKEEAARYLLTLHILDPENTKFSDAVAQLTLSDFLDVKDPATPKRPAKAKVKTLVVSEAIAADVVASVEDDKIVPFDDNDFLETPVDLTKLYESVGLDAPTVYDDEVDTEDQPF